MATLASFLNFVGTWKQNDDMIVLFERAKLVKPISLAFKIFQDSRLVKVMKKNFLNVSKKKENIRAGLQMK